MIWMMLHLLLLAPIYGAWCTSAERIREPTMKQRKINCLMQAIVQMNWRQRKLLRDRFDAPQTREASTRAIESHAPSSCPECGSTHIVRNGFARGLQRYLCRSCQHTFNAFSGAPLARLHKRHKWLAHTQVLSAGLSIAQGARQLGIARSTAFHWRHCFLQLPSQLQAHVLVGNAEADESYFLASGKDDRGLLRKARYRGGKASKDEVSKQQVAVLMVRDRSGAAANLIVPRTATAQLSQVLKPMLARGHGTAHRCQPLAGRCRPHARCAAPQRQRERRCARGWALACAERERLCQPLPRLDAQVQGRGHQIPSLLLALVSHARPNASI